MSLSAAPCDGLTRAVAHMTLARGKYEKKSTITGVMSKFNTCASAHLGSRRGPYISSDTPRVFAEGSRPELNRQGRYHWSERERESERDGECWGFERMFRSSVLAFCYSEAAFRRMSNSATSSFGLEGPTSCRILFHNVF